MSEMRVLVKRRARIGINAIVVSVLHGGLVRRSKETNRWLLEISLHAAGTIKTTRTRCMVSEERVNSVCKVLVFGIVRLALAHVANAWGITSPISLFVIVMKGHGVSDPAALLLVIGYRKARFRIRKYKVMSVQNLKDFRSTDTCNDLCRGYRSLDLGNAGQKACKSGSASSKTQTVYMIGSK